MGLFRKINDSKRRALALFLCVIMLFSVLCMRIAIIQNGMISDVADMQFSKKILLGSTRGYIYDRNYIPLVNDNKKSYTVYLTDMLNAVNESQAENAGVGEVKNGICISSGKMSGDDSNFLKNYYTLERYSENSLCEHIIGYTDSLDNGVSGIEKAFDRILAEAKGSLFAVYNSDAGGYALPGGGLKLSENNYDSPAGVVLTLDKNIQQIAETAIENSEIQCGAAVVMNVDTFEIAAIVSVPGFDRNDIAKSLENSDRPFFNRALGAYPVGSVFKPVVAVGAFENCIDLTQQYVCDGYCQVGRNVFRCYNGNAHGKEDINKAIEKSCNSYFIDVALKIGAEKLCETASLFGFGKEISLCTALISDSGYLPSVEELSSDSALANLSFGQGQLLASPVQIAAVYSVLANGGKYKEPVILKELINDSGEVYAYYKSETEYTVCSKETCERINICLYNNMLNGTGTSGAPEGVSSAGKTATAQTGRYDENGNEQLCTWFAGFFPFDNPEYAVVIFNENGSTASVDCAPVFKEIVENIAYLEKNK